MEKHFRSVDVNQHCKNVFWRPEYHDEAHDNMRAEESQPWLRCLSLRALSN